MSKEIREDRSSGPYTGQVTYREFNVNGLACRVPVAGYLFSHSGSWARIDGRRARTGLSDFALQSVGEAVSFEPPLVGLDFAVFDEICSIMTNVTSVEMVSPLSGKVIKVNKGLIEDSRPMNEDPYESGWVVELELTDIDDDVEVLMTGEQYEEFVKTKFGGGLNRACPCTRQGAIVRRGDARGPGQAGRSH